MAVLSEGASHREKILWMYATKLQAVTRSLSFLPCNPPLLFFLLPELVRRKLTVHPNFKDMVSHHPAAHWGWWALLKQELHFATHTVSFT